MKNWYPELFVFLLAFIGISQLSQQPQENTARVKPADKTEVLLLGTFHFANPGLDFAKFENANILSEPRQKEVETLVEKIKAFKVDKIFVEIVPSEQKKYDSLLNAYKNGKHSLAASEVQQLGFRLAKEWGLNTIYCSNYTNFSFPIDSVMKTMMANRQMDLLQWFQTEIKKAETDFNERLKKNTIMKMLADENTDENYKKMVGAYYLFLKAGDKENHAGSFLSSEQWRRNTYIYENILKNLDGKEKRILILYGTTHVAFLKEMMKYNESFTFLPASQVLK